MRLLLIALLAILINGCASVAQDDKAKVVIELQEKAGQHYAQGDYPAALKEYLQLVEYIPLSAQSWLRLGNCQAQLGAYDDAVVSYRTALAIDEKYSGAWINLTYVQAQILSQTVADMYEQVPKSDPQAQRVQRLVDTVLEPFKPAADANSGAVNDTGVGIGTMPDGGQGAE